MTRKRLDLGEYIITVDYDKKTSKLDVRVLDETGEIIEAILISEDEEPDVTAGFEINLN